MRRHWTLRWIVAAGLALLTAAVFSGALRGGFVYDDQGYITGNMRLHEGITPGTVAWAFTTFTGANWHPLTWFSHLLDVSLFGLDPWGHHLSGILLHALAAALLFLALEGMTGSLPRSLAAAALFALHPLRVESVAWVSERKDVLSAVCFGLILLLYLRWLRRPTAWRSAVLAAGYAIGLMAKPMLVTIPCLLMLIDWWPLGRLRGFPAPRGRTLARLAAEKIPLFVLAAAGSILAMHSQGSVGTLRTLDDYPLGVRLANGFAAVLGYLRMTVWPSGLAVFYPHPGSSLDAWRWITGAAVCLACVVGIVRAARRAPWLATGWCWFIGMLMPVLGFVQVGGQAMADRYTYLPSAGLALAVVWGVATIPGGEPCRRRLLFVAAVAASIALAAVSIVQVGYWKSQRTLFTRALAVTGRNPVARMNLGVAAHDEGRLDEAEAHYRAAIDEQPTYLEARNNLAHILAERGRSEEAELHYRMALAMRADSPEVLVNLGGLVATRGGTFEAIELYGRALRLRPDYPEALMNMANLLSDSGRYAEADSRYQRLIALHPGYAEAWYNLGVSLERRGRREEAIDAYRTALAVAPGLREARIGLRRLGLAR